MKNYETTLKNHGNQPKTLKNHETTLTDRPFKKVMIFCYRHCIIIYISSLLSGGSRRNPFQHNSVHRNLITWSSTSKDPRLPQVPSFLPGDCLYCFIKYISQMQRFPSFSSMYIGEFHSQMAELCYTSYLSIFIGTPPHYLDL